MSRTNPRKWTKRKAKKAKQGNTEAVETEECVAAECNRFECKSDGQHGRDGFPVSENTVHVICDKHFRKHEIIKGTRGVRYRLGKGMVSFQ